MDVQSVNPITRTIGPVAHGRQPGLNVSISGGTIVRPNPGPYEGAASADPGPINPSEFPGRGEATKLVDIPLLFLLHVLLFVVLSGLLHVLLYAFLFVLRFFLLSARHYSCFSVLLYVLLDVWLYVLLYV